MAAAWSLKAFTVSKHVGRRLPQVTGSRLGTIPNRHAGPSLLEVGDSLGTGRDWCAAMRSLAGANESPSPEADRWVGHGSVRWAAARSEMHPL